MWPQSAELLEDLGIFDEVVQHNFQCDRYWRSLWTTLKLRLRRYDVSILAFPANRFEYNVLAYLLGAKRRYGHTYIRGGDGQYDSFADPKTAGVDQGETAAVDRLLDRGDQAAAVRIASNVGKAFAVGLADFLWVSSGQS
ncbi:MAG: hypothetical protein JXQ75_02470, partial [Phycisphaerae bacterium]|nr:hypothetical protein [Phycisphaerae bacterium]